MEPTEKVVEARAFRLKMPLKALYPLSLGEVNHFHLFLVSVELEDGQGVGETVPLPGYSHETEELVWRLLREWAGLLPGMDTEEALLRMEPVRKKYPFAAAPLTTAIETALLPLKSSEQTSVPLLGTVMSHGQEELEYEIESLLQRGYAVLKVKVGWDEQEDAAYVRRVQQIVGDRALIRVDANQAYSLEQATYLIHHIDPDGIELFEQPFGIGDWDSMVRLCKISPLPLMLDESINSGAELEKMIHLRCAQAVKFKLMKAGGLAELERLILRAKEAGLKVVLGNGVAGDIGNFHELVVAGRYIETAGEMNGFLKQEQRLLSNPYEVSRGKVTLPGGYVPQVDWRKVEAYAVESTPAKESSVGIKET